MLKKLTCAIAIDARSLTATMQEVIFWIVALRIVYIFFIIIMSKLIQ